MLKYITYKRIEFIKIIMNNLIARKKEISEIKKAVKAEQSIALVGPQYRGKTAILKSLEKELEKRTVIYFHLASGYSLKNFAEQYSKLIFKSLSSKLKDIFEDSDKYLPRIKPKISSDAVKGIDISIDYHIGEEEIKAYIKQVLAMPARICADKKMKMVVVFDEFHYVEELKEIDIAKEIFSGQGVTYVLASSNEKALSKLIKNYHLDVKTLQIPRLPKSILYELIDSEFSKAGIKTTESVKENIIKLADGEIAFIKHVLQIMLDSVEEHARVGLKDVSKAINLIVNFYDDIFHNYFFYLSNHQKVLVVAIAGFGGHQIFKGDFIFKNSLGSVPSVQTSIKALIKKSFVYKDGQEYKFSNIFFLEWLKRKFL